MCVCVSISLIMLIWNKTGKPICDKIYKFGLAILHR